MENEAIEQASAGWSWFVSNSMNVLYAIAIIVVALFLAKLAKRFIVQIANSKPSLDDTLFEFLGSLVFYIILVFAGLMVLERFGITTTSLVALIGAAGLAIGLALQGTLSNLAAGVMLLLFRPFKVGDFIDGAGVFGKVDAISLFTTDLVTFDNQQIIIPNSELWGTKLINHSHFEDRGVDLTFGVSYGTDLKKAEKAIRKVLSAHDKVLETPEPFIAVDKLNDSSVDFLVRPFCKGEHYFDLRYSLPQLVKEEFDRQKIEIPFPHRKVIMAK
ncbi:mechanosensitive ion channel family protein [Salaquimonas pukyongi]|uniref:mechanosensitive ion channel family protein n=1 Tax=Salaquimonas pukyongi TaxID=2712698 RepID=UPI00096BC0FC|nr:mechanosensitive ion channel family protein [Salaquimonas pukyongi]